MLVKFINNSLKILLLEGGPIYIEIYDFDVNPEILAEKGGGLDNMISFRVTSIADLEVIIAQARRRSILRREGREISIDLTKTGRL
jgi:hypothetical protein